MPNVGDVVRLRFRFLDDNGAPLAVNDTPTLHLELNGTVVYADDASLTSESFEEWWFYSYTTTAAGVVFARAKTTDTDAAGNGTTDALTFDVTSYASIAAAVWDRATSLLTTAGSIGKALVDFIAYATTKLGLITAGAVNFTAPVSPNSDRLTLYQGQMYSDDSGLTLPAWSSSDWTPFDLSAAASVTWYLRSRYNPALSGTVAVVSDTEIEIRTFTSAVTDALAVGTNAYTLQIWAVLDAAHDDAEVILVDCPVTVLDDIRS